MHIRGNTQALQPSGRDQTSFSSHYSKRRLCVPQNTPVCPVDITHVPLLPTNSTSLTAAQTASLYYCHLVHVKLSTFIINNKFPTWHKKVKINQIIWSAIFNFILFIRKMELSLKVSVTSLVSFHEYLVRNILKV